MSYTIVYKDYYSGDIGVAAEQMLRDDEIWIIKYKASDTPDQPTVGETSHYLMSSWEWHPEEGRLRVWFR